MSSIAFGHNNSGLESKACGSSLNPWDDSRSVITKNLRKKKFRKENKKQQQQIDESLSFVHFRRRAGVVSMNPKNQIVGDMVYSGFSSSFWFDLRPFRVIEEFFYRSMH